MRKLNGFKWLYVLAVMVTAANADIIIDNQAIPSADISSITISPDTGNIFVATIPGYTVTPAVIGNNVAITNFTVSPSTILAGGSTTVSWNTANAVSCTATNGVGGWLNSVIALPSGSKLITAATAGTYQFTLTCNGSQVGDTKTSNVTLTVNPANAVSITSFTANLATITAGQSTTLSWVTQNATSCTPSGGTGGWSSLSLSVPSGSTQITLTTAGSYSFTLTCRDAASGTAVKSTVVTVNPAGGQCTTPPLTGTVTQWKTFWTVDFPRPLSYRKSVTVPRTGYIALQFNTGESSTSGYLLTTETTTTSGLRLGAISQCPGDFRPVAAGCSEYWGISNQLRWATNGAAGCQLLPNTTYYFNLTFTDGLDPAKSTCSSSPCVTTLGAYSDPVN